jgi:hypothetical protein
MLPWTDESLEAALRERSGALLAELGIANPA